MCINDVLAHNRPARRHSYPPLLPSHLSSSTFLARTYLFTQVFTPSSLPINLTATIKILQTTVSTEIGRYVGSRLQKELQGDDRLSALEKMESQDGTREGADRRRVSRGDDGTDERVCRRGRNLRKAKLRTSRQASRDEVTQKSRRKESDFATAKKRSCRRSSCPANGTLSVSLRMEVLRKGKG